MSGLELGILGVHRLGAIFKPEGGKYGRNAFGNLVTKQHKTKRKNKCKTLRPE
jgi:hypothetical protein